ncbi:MAG: hypothetical protein M1495_03970 [Bacteroidetes bacterium]|nr:hypothetical protein [Bacteroidota bacterium]
MRLETKLVSPQYINYVYINERFEHIKKLLSGGTSVINSDIQSSCYMFTVPIWQSKFFSGVCSIENSILPVGKSITFTL